METNNFLGNLKAVIEAAKEKTASRRDAALLEATKKMLLGIAENCITVPAKVQIGEQIIPVPEGQETVYSSLPGYIPGKVGMSLIDYINQ
jgi:hypothetical protein